MSHLSPKLSKAKLVMELDFFEQFSNTVNTVDIYEFTVHIQIAKKCWPANCILLQIFAGQFDNL